MFNFVLDVIDGIKDMFETIKDKEERIVVKINFLIITLVSLYFSWKLWM